MNDEQAKALGERALALGMPWVDGVRDGAERRRLGDYLDCGCCFFGEEDACLDEVWRPVWPDLRDPVTEAWLVAWASDFFARRGWGADEEPGRESLEVGMGLNWFICLSHNEMFIDVSGKTRAEAWILALEKLKGEG